MEHLIVYHTLYGIPVNGGTSITVLSCLFMAFIAGRLSTDIFTRLRGIKFIKQEFNKEISKQQQEYDELLKGFN